MNQKLLFAIFGITVLGHYTLQSISIIGLSILMLFIFFNKVKLYSFEDLSFIQKTLIKTTYIVLITSGIFSAIPENWSEGIFFVLGTGLFAGLIYTATMAYLKRTEKKESSKKLLFDFYLSFCLFIPMYLFAGAL